MEINIFFLLKLYGPFLLSLIFFFAIFLVKKSGEGTAITFKPFGYFFDIKIPLSNLIIARSILLIASLLSLLTLLALDFSKLFPSHFKMEVFYDEKGIRNALSALDKGELKGLNIPQDYELYQKKYYKDLDAEIVHMLSVQKFFAVKEGSIHSSGETSFIIEKVEGLQRYHIKESRGELLHLCELPNQPVKQFKTFFEKLPTSDDYINPSLGQLVFKRSIMLRPQFKQILAQNIKADGIVFHHSVVGVTKVTVFPWPSFSDTIYFARFPSIGLVPVAYAVYR